MPQKAVDLIRKHQLLHGHTLLAKMLYQRQRLDEAHIAIVITVNEQYRCAPILHLGQW